MATTYSEQRADDPDRQVFSGEAGQILGISISRVRALVRRGDLPIAGKIGHFWTFRVGDVLAVREIRQQQRRRRGHRPTAA